MLSGGHVDGGPGSLRKRLMGVVSQLSSWQGMNVLHGILTHVCCGTKSHLDISDWSLLVVGEVCVLSPAIALRDQDHHLWGGRRAYPPGPRTPPLQA